MRRLQVSARRLVLRKALGGGVAVFASLGIVLVATSALPVESAQATQSCMSRKYGFPMRWQRTLVRGTSIELLRTKGISCSRAHSIVLMNARKPLGRDKYLLRVLGWRCAWRGAPERCVRGNAVIVLAIGA